MLGGGNPGALAVKDSEEGSIFVSLVNFTFSVKEIEKKDTLVQ